MTTDPYDIIHAAMLRFVTLLCEGAWDTEEDPHEDVIALAYAMPPSITSSERVACKGCDGHGQTGPGCFMGPETRVMVVSTKGVMIKRSNGDVEEAEIGEVILGPCPGCDGEGWVDDCLFPGWVAMCSDWLTQGRAPDVVAHADGWEHLGNTGDVCHMWCDVGSCDRPATWMEVGSWGHCRCDYHPPPGVEFSGPFLDTFHSNPEWAASLVAKVISDGLDDGLLVGWYDVRGWDEPEDQELHNLASLQTLVDLAGLADNDERRRLLDHVERILDTVEANEAHGRGAVL